MSVAPHPEKMSAEQHYDVARTSLRKANGQPLDAQAVLIAHAQVHATLALQRTLAEATNRAVEDEGA